MSASIRRRLRFAAVSAALFAGLQHATAQEILPPPLPGAKPAPAVETAPAPEKKETAGDKAAPGCDACGFDFKKVPPVRIFPRTGFFPNLPSGPGYYSLRDHLNHDFREKAPKFGYPPYALMSPSFFDADWRYLDDPKNKDHDWSDAFHRMHLGDNFLFNTGGQAWWRHMSETNSRLTENNNSYDLFRVRAYGDLWFRDMARVYVEFISAQSFNQDLAPLAIDRDFADLQNAFVDLKIPFLCDDHPGYVRVGRQELLFGSQRLISPPDWANVRRTFDGIRAFRQGEKFDIDVFWAQPVLPVANEFNQSDHKQNFGGVWTTYRPQKGQFLDLYYLVLENDNQTVQQRIIRSPFTAHTVGSRYAGDKNQWLWDIEGAFQFGSFRATDTDICAGMFTLGGGYHFKNLPMNPTFWAYYDFASGDRSPNVGTMSTFNQLFPFGHYYLGWGDWIGRQNINDFNMHLYMYPTNYITVWLQYHHFWLNSSRDALYNIGGNVSKVDLTGAAGTNVGQELDLVVNVHLTKHQDFMIGYSRLFAGDFLQTVGPAGGADLFYAMYSVRW